ncbi:MAG: PepSY domain-containing protein [Acidaminococcaceae bacterium]|nr:PepSY domain-containing protein [Acidaminococcaceae bacterium]
MRFDRIITWVLLVFFCMVLSCTAYGDTPVREFPSSSQISEAVAIEIACSLASEIRGIDQSELMAVPDIWTWLRNASGSVDLNGYETEVEDGYWYISFKHRPSYFKFDCFIDAKTGEVLYWLLEDYRQASIFYINAYPVESDIDDLRAKAVALPWIRSHFDPAESGMPKEVISTAFSLYEGTRIWEVHFDYRDAENIHNCRGHVFVSAESGEIMEATMTIGTYLFTEDTVVFNEEQSINYTNEAY